MKQVNSERAQTIDITEGWRLYDCGEYSFEIHEGKLIVLEPLVNTPNRPQNHYDLTKIANNQWFALKDFRGEQLPVYVNWNRIVLNVRVGTPPAGEVRILSVSNFSQEWQFEANLNGIHVHPHRGFWMKYHNSYPHSGGSVMVKSDVAGESVDYPIDKLPERQWITLRHPNGGNFPLKIYRVQNAITAEWLSLDTLSQQRDQVSAETKSEVAAGQTGKQVAKVVGVLVGLGVDLAGRWLASRKSERKELK